jgi:poly(A) polymerase
VIFAPTPIEKELFDIIGRVADLSGNKAFVIGGWVRDRFMARQNKAADIDVVSDGDGIALCKAVAAELFPSPRVVEYSRFGVGSFVWKQIELEFVSARSESYLPESRKPIVQKGSIEDDQWRRDFTINAMAVCLNPGRFGELVDPFDGLTDIQRKIIRTPTDPGTTFSDDPLRMMRAIRFACQFQFTIEPETLNGISQYADRLHIVSKERIAVELEKIMATPKPSVGWRLLFETGLLPHILPELQNLHGVEEKNGIKHKDNFYHTLQVVDNLAVMSDNQYLRWAALFHDIGKGPTKRFENKQGWTFWNHENVGAAMVPRLFKNLGLPLDQRMRYVQKIVTHHQRPISLTQTGVTDSAVRRLLFDLGDDIDDLMMLCESDITSRQEYRVKKYLDNYRILRERLVEIEANDHLRNWQPTISGEIIMETFGIGPSKEVGLIKNAIREAILDGHLVNEYETAYAFMLQVAAENGLKPVVKIEKN